MYTQILSKVNSNYFLYDSLKSALNHPKILIAFCIISYNNIFGIIDFLNFIMIYTREFLRSLSVV